MDVLVTKVDQGEVRDLRNPVPGGATDPIETN